MKETHILLTKRLVFTQRQFFEELECLSLEVDISRQEIREWVHDNWKHICRWITNEGYTVSLSRSLRLLEATGDHP
jgi:hypothetical protein